MSAAPGGPVTITMLPRMRELWDAGLSYQAIAAVVSLDWGRQVTGGQVRYWLRFHTRGVRVRNRAGITNSAGNADGVPAARAVV